MPNLVRTVGFAIIILSSGCYHASVVTGLKPSTETIEQSFAASWIYGLVPPNTVATETKCANGIAKVETQLNFLNQLVAILTLGIYTPMEIKVTCAEKSTVSLGQKGADIVLHSDATTDEVLLAFKHAGELAVSEHRPVYVEY